MDIQTIRQTNRENSCTLCLYGARPNYLYITAVKYLKLLQLVNFVQILLRKNL